MIGRPLTAVRVFLARVRGLFQSDARIDEELSAHLDFLAAEYEAAGMSQTEARAAARRDLGHATQIREQYREQRRLPFLDSLLRDLGYAARQWRAHPGFAATAILTLALGIGASTTIFQLLDRIVLRSLPVRNPQRLVRVQGYWGAYQQGFSYPLLREMDARQSVVEGIFASGTAPVDEIAIGGRTLGDPPPASIVSGNYFRAIGTLPQLGRFFTDSDDAATSEPVAVLSDRFWREQFAAQPSAIGSIFQVNHAAVTVVGVARPEFFGERIGSSPAFWMPIHVISRIKPTPLTASLLTPSSIWLQPMARLRPGVSTAQAQAQLNALWSQLRDYSMQFGVNRETVFHLELLPGERGLDVLQTQFSRPLWLLMGITALVALIACSNLASLLLARATARTHEMGVRLALGAGRRRLLRQLLTESMALALCGGAAGLALAAAGSRALVRLASTGETWQLSTGLDIRVATFTLLATLGCTLIFGLAPAFAATRVNLNSALHAKRRTSTGGFADRAFTRGFVVVQISLSLVLIAGASLLVRSFWKLRHQEFGYKTENLVMAQLAYSSGSFEQFLNPARNLALAERVRQMPGIVNAGISAAGLLSTFGIPPNPVSVPGQSLPPTAAVRVVPVTPGYIEALGVSLKRGRSLTDDDRPQAAHVAVISETAARAMFGSADPIGRIFSSGATYDPKYAFEVVGLINDLRYASPQEPIAGIAFAPIGQIYLGTPPALMLRTATPIAALTQQLEPVLREFAPTAKIGRLVAVPELIQEKARRERLLAWLSGGFGALALLLAAVGLYGVVSYGAARRIQEMGIRLALGARPAQIRALLFQETAFLLGSGVVLGGAGTFLLTRTLRSLLFGLTPFDPATLAFALLFLSAVALGAGYLPARRAARLDPTEALRAE